MIALQIMKKLTKPITMIDIWRYKITVDNYLDKLEPNNSIVQCKNFMCSNAEHIVQIEQYQNNLISTCLELALKEKKTLRQNRVLL